MRLYSPVDLTGNCVLWAPSWKMLPERYVVVSIGQPEGNCIFEILSER